jgi:hypothetical protein
MDPAAPHYDPTVLEQYAEGLYRKADSMRVGARLVGGAVGVVFGAVPLSPLGKYLPVPTTFALALVLLGALVGALIGHVIGEGRAFRTRMQAQLVLFQLQLERNTRLAAQPEPARAPAPAPAPEPAPAPIPVAAPPPAPAPEPPPAIPVVPVLPARQPVAAAAGQALPPLSPR